MKKSLNEQLITKTIQREETSKLQKDLDQKHSLLVKTEAELRQLKQNLEKINVEHALLSSLRKQFQGVQKKLKDELAHELQEKTRLQTLLEQSDARHNQLNGQSSTLQNELTVFKTEYTSLNAELKILKQDQETYSNLGIEHMALKQEHSRLQTQLTVANEKLLTLQDQLTEFEQVSSQYAVLNETHEELTGQHTVLNETHEELTSQHAVLSETHEELTVHLEELKTTHEKVLKQEQETYFNLNAEHIVLKQEHSRLQTQFTAANEKLLTLQDQLTEFEQVSSQYAVLNETHEELTGQHTVLNETHEELTSQHAVLSETHEELTVHLEELQIAHESLLDTHEELLDTHNLTHNELSNLQSKHEGALQITYKLEKELEGLKTQAELSNKTSTQDNISRSQSLPILVKQLQHEELHFDELDWTNEIEESLISSNHEHVYEVEHVINLKEELTGSGSNAPHSPVPPSVLTN